MCTERTLMNQTYSAVLAREDRDREEEYSSRQEENEEMRNGRDETRERGGEDRT
jgi:hypothetical protein